MVLLSDLGQMFLWISEKKCIDDTEEYSSSAINTLLISDLMGTAYLCQLFLYKNLLETNSHSLYRMMNTSYSLL